MISSLIQITTNTNNKIACVCVCVITVANQLSRWADPQSINVSGEQQQVHKAAQVQEDRQTHTRVDREANRPVSSDSSVLL